MKNVFVTKITNLFNDLDYVKMYAFDQRNMQYCMIYLNFQPPKYDT